MTNKTKNFAAQIIKGTIDFTSYFKLKTNRDWKKYQKLSKNETGWNLYSIDELHEIEKTNN